MTRSIHKKWTRSMARVAVLSGAALVGFVPSGHAKAAESKFVFDLVRSPGLKAIPGCVPDVSGIVTIQPGGPLYIGITIGKKCGDLGRLLS